MTIQFNRLLTGAAIVTALSLSQPGWSQQGDTHDNHENPDTEVRQNDTLIGNESQLSPQNGGQGEVMRQRQGDGQGGMMQQRQGDGQGGMMQQRQGDGQGGMMQQRQGDSQGGLMQQRQGDGQGGMMQQRQGDSQGGMMQQGQGDGQGGMMQHMEHMRAMMSGGQQASTGGQDAFSAIRAVVNQLEANPDTDWSRINIDALREHLVDMQEVTVNAAVETSQVAGGASYRVTGANRTLQAIQRMVPAHAMQISSETAWTATTRAIADGIEVKVTAGSDDDVARIRALGFFGFMVSGEHHDRHHLAIAGADMEPLSESQSDGGHGAGGDHSH